MPRLELDQTRDNWLSTFFDLSANYKFKLTIEGEWANSDDDGTSSGDGFDATLEVIDHKDRPKAVASVIAAEGFEEAMQEIASQTQPWLSKQIAEDKELTDLCMKQLRRERAEKKKPKVPARTAKCSVIGCSDEPNRAWQPFGPDGRLTMTRLGYHYRGFPIFKLCHDHVEAVKSGTSVQVKFRGKVVTIDPTVEPVE